MHVLSARTTATDDMMSTAITDWYIRIGGNMTAVPTMARVKMEGTHPRNEKWRVPSIEYLEQKRL